MRSGIIAVLFVVVVGIIIVQILINFRGTKVVLDGVTDFWKTSVNGLLGRTTA